MALLSPYRVLDLTDERGQVGGMIMADLGADVIRVEPLGGSEARRVGPFLENGEPAERSLSFAAYNRNKRSVEIDLESEVGRGHFLRLVRDSDFVLDSGPPSLLDAADLDFGRLLEVHEQLVQVRVTPFGRDGPMANVPASDLTIAALAGPMSVQGDADRPPVRLSVPQVWRHAGAESAVAALVGHARMRTTGRGVFVDVSAQCALTWTMLNATLAGPIQGFDYEREGSNLQIGPKGGLPMVHRCQDGNVVALGLGALFGKLRPWILESGVVDEAWLDREEWTSYDYRVFRGGEFEITLSELTEVFDRFFLTRTRKELFAPGLEIGATIAPVQTLDDLLEFEQLIARAYFRDLELDTGLTARAPGAFARLSKTPIDGFARAPRLGEHNQAILDQLEGPTRRRLPIVSEHKALPLEGLKVADFSWVGVGPITGKYLADHGANVIRIESSTKADNLRTAGPYKDDVAGWNRSHFYGEFNTSKRSLALDLKHEGSAEVKARLLGWADVVLESFTPGAVDRLGIGYEAARAANPGVILVSTCLMGQTGPFASMAGYGYHAAAVAGFYELTGWPDRPPAGPWNAYTDTVAPRFLTATLLAALDHQRRTGEGQHIDLGQLEAALHFLAPEILARQVTGEEFHRAGNRDPHRAPQGVYPCASNSARAGANTVEDAAPRDAAYRDEWLAIAVETDAQWRALRTAIGDPEWARDPRYDDVSARLADHDAIDAGLSAWTRERKPREAMQRLLDAGVPAGHVQRSSDLPNDPQLIHRGFHREFEHGEMGCVPYSGHQFRISDYDNGPLGPAPLLGGESFEILSDELGFDPEAIAELMAKGAIN